MITNEKTKTLKCFVAERGLYKALEMVANLDTEESVSALLTLLEDSYVENSDLCNKLIESNNQLIDFLSCEDWEAFQAIKGQYNIASDWTELRDEYKGLLNRLEANIKHIVEVRSDIKSLTDKM